MRCEGISVKKVSGGCIFAFKSIKWGSGTYDHNRVMRIVSTKRRKTRSVHKSIGRKGHTTKTE